MADYATESHPQSDNVPTSGLWQTDPEFQRLFHDALALQKPNSRVQSPQAQAAMLAFTRYRDANRQRLGIPDNYTLDPRTSGQTLYDPNNNQLRDAGITAAAGVGGGFGISALAGGAGAAGLPEPVAGAWGPGTTAFSPTGVAATTVPGSVAAGGAPAIATTTPAWASGGALSGAATGPVASASATGASMAGTGATGFLGSMKNLLTDPKFLIGTGANVLGGILSSHAAGKAADQQAKSAQASLDLQRNIYEQNRNDQMPWLNAGRGAVSSLSRLMGVDNNPASTYSQTSPQPQQAVQRSPLAALAGGGGGGMVQMRAPDGSTRPVPAAMASQLEARGAVRVG